MDFSPLALQLFARDRAELDSAEMDSAALGRAELDRAASAGAAREPDPLGIVEHDRPQARILQRDAAAARRGVRVGMRYGAALGLCPQLRVTALDDVALDAQRDIITERLRAFSPIVERNSLWADSFWLGGRGLSKLWESASAWGRDLQLSAALLSLQASVVVGFNRFYTLGLARALPGELRVFRSPEEERETARGVPLSALGLDHRLHVELERLGVRTLGALQTLPTGAVQRRYGAEAAALIRLAREEAPLITQAPRVVAPVIEALEWDEPIATTEALLFALQAGLSRALARVHARGERCAELRLTLAFDWPRYVDDALRRRAAAAGVGEGEALALSLTAARASSDLDLWSGLLRLRFERLALPLGVRHAAIEARAERVMPQAESLAFGERRPTPEALLDELAKLRAELGDDAVGQLDVRDAHLPEVRQGWRPVTALAPPQPHPHFEARLLRGLVPRPTPLEGGREDAPPRDWLALPRGQGRAARMLGPYVLSGGWWQREVERAYYYVYLVRGDVLWVFFDRRRMRWFLHARVY